MIYKKLYKIHILLALIAVVVSCFLLTNNALGATDTAKEKFTSGLESSATQAGLAETSGEAGLTNIITSVIGGLLYFAATILLVFIIWGGYMWMTAGGNEQQVEKGQKYIKNAVIGYIIIAASYLIVQLVSTELIGQTTDDAQQESDQ